MYCHLMCFNANRGAMVIFLVKNINMTTQRFGSIRHECKAYNLSSFQKIDTRDNVLDRMALAMLKGNVSILLFFLVNPGI